MIFFFQSLMLNLPSESLGNLVRFEMFFFFYQVNTKMYSIMQE